MIQTQPYQNRIHIFHVTDGKIWTFKDEMEASKYTNAIQALGNIGEHFYVFENENWYCYPDDNSDRNIPLYRKYDIILRDDHGEIVSFGRLIQLWNETFRKKRRSFACYSWSKNNSHRWYRRMRTTNERRQAVENRDAYDDYGVVVKPRGRRNYHGLPNSWDDFCRPRSRNWKMHRKHQWVDNK